MAETLTQLEKEMLVKRTFPEKNILNLFMLLYPEKPVQELIKERVKTCSASPFVLEGKYGKENAVLSISKKEGIEIATTLAERGELLTPFYQLKEELIQKDPQVYFHIPKEMRDERDALTLIESSPRHVPFIFGEQTSFEMKKAFAKTGESWNIPNGFLDNCTDAEIMELIDINPDLIRVLPKERFTKEILYFYLERMVKKHLQPVISHFSARNVPDELKDKIYWRSLCMVSGYCYSLVPEDKREEYITPKIVEYTMSHLTDKQYVDYCWMAQFMPNACKTRDVFKKLILNHPFAAQHLPEELKNDDFYREIAEIDCRFIEHIDFNTASSEVLEDCFSKLSQVNLCNRKLPKEKWTNKLALAIAKAYNEFSIIPSEFQTREVAEEYLVYHAGLDKIPKRLWDNELFLHAVRHNYYSLRHIPKEHLTDEFWKTCKKEQLLEVSQLPPEYVDEDYVTKMIEKGWLYSFEQIPKEYRKPEVIKKFAEFQSRNRIIPKEYQTAEVVESLRKTWDMPTSYAERYFWSTIKEDLRDMAALDRLATTEESSIEILLTKEQIEANLEKWPENILFAPNWYLKQHVRANMVQTEEEPMYSYNCIVNIPENENTVYPVYHLVKGTLTKELIARMLEDAQKPLSNYSLYKGNEDNEVNGSNLEKYDSNKHTVKLVVIHGENGSDSKLADDVIQLDKDTYFSELKTSGELNMETLKKCLISQLGLKNTKKKTAEKPISDTTCFKQLTIWDILSA